MTRLPKEEAPPRRGFRDAETGSAITYCRRWAGISAGYSKHCPAGRQPANHTLRLLEPQFQVTSPFGLVRGSRISGYGGLQVAGEGGHEVLLEPWESWSQGAADRRAPNYCAAHHFPDLHKFQNGKPGVKKRSPSGEGLPFALQLVRITYGRRSAGTSA